MPFAGNPRLDNRTRFLDAHVLAEGSAARPFCRRKFSAFDGRVLVILADFDRLDLADETFDAISSLESIGYTKDLDAWLARCWRMLRPGGRLLGLGFDPIRYRQLPFWAWGMTWNFIKHLLLWKFRRRSARWWGSRRSSGGRRRSSSRTTSSSPVSRAHPHPLCTRAPDQAPRGSG